MKLKSSILLVPTSVLCAFVFGCYTPDESNLVTMSEYRTHIEKRIGTDSLSCGQSDITKGFESQSNPETTTCLHNALANSGSAFGHYLFEFVNTNSILWFSYTVRQSNVHYYTYSQNVLNSSNRSPITTYSCHSAEIPSYPPASSAEIFDCGPL